MLEWGTMLTDVNQYLSVGPVAGDHLGVAIVISVLGFNLIGDGLRDVLDRGLRGGRRRSD